MPNFVYPDFLLRLGRGEIDFATDVFKVCLLSSAYNPDINDAVFDDVADAEIASGNGYAAGGQEMAGRSWALSFGRAIFTAADATWPAASITARYAVIYNATHPEKILMGLLDFEEDRGVVNGPFVVDFAQDGIMGIG